MPQDPATDVVAAVDALMLALDAFRASLVNPEPVSATRMVSIKEAARSLCLSDRSIRRLAKAGQGEKVGGVWRIDLDAVKARLRS